MSLLALALLVTVLGCTAPIPPSESPPPAVTAVPTGTPLPSVTPSPPKGGGLPQGRDPVVLDPADFVVRIDHPYWPMTPGSRWVYREVDEAGVELRVEVTVTDETKAILGITVTVVHDVVTQEGLVLADTSIGTPRTATATSGTSASTPPSTRTAWS